MSSTTGGTPTSTTSAAPACEGMHLTRLATGNDIAAAVACLAGPDAATVTGILLPVDGGSSTAARSTSFG